LENKLIYGQGAADLKHNHQFKLGKNIWYSFKTQLGTDVGALYYDSEIQSEKNKIRNPKDALRFFLGFIKARIQTYVDDHHLPLNTQYAVSIPASFEANQRKDLIDALALNGISITKQALIDEPNAAFLSYIEQSFTEKSPLKVPEHRNINILVFDFGAGTCDISILEIGNGLKGLYSKNLAISKYFEIGGDDIDKYIALEILFPQFAQQNGFKTNDFRKGEIKKDILPKLFKSAEQLKIMICEKTGLLTQDNLLPARTIAIDHESLEIEISRVGKLTLNNPKITYKQFNDLMFNFCYSGKSMLKNESTSNFENIFSKKFESIFSPIKSAMIKGKLSNDDLDYILFIGGSSKNPFIRLAVKEYFKDANPEIIVPGDLQTHVSKGAAIHSLIFNGFNKNLIQPITSEPILLLTKQGMVSVLPAGTEVPSEIHKIEDLEIANANQEIIELPIFIGNKNKMLFNFKWYVPENKFYSVGTKVKVIAEINADKILNIRAYINNQEMACEPLYPLSTGDKTTEERTVLVAEKQFNLEAERNGGRPTLEGYRNLYKAYQLAGMTLLAAQTMEELNDNYPNNSNLNEIGVLFSDAGVKEKAIEYYEKAHQASPNNSTIAFNLAYQYKNKDNQKFEEMLEKVLLIEPDDPEALFEKGKILNKKKSNAGQDLIQKAFDIYKAKFDKDRLKEWEYSWFASCADELGKTDFSQIIRDSKPKQNTVSLWNENNLTRSSSNVELLKY
jgi:molecular chaperone DnaK